MTTSSPINEPPGVPWPSHDIQYAHDYDGSVRGRSQKRTYRGPQTNYHYEKSALFLRVDLSQPTVLQTFKAPDCTFWSRKLDLKSCSFLT